MSIRRGSRFCPLLLSQWFNIWQNLFYSRAYTESLVLLEEIFDGKKKENKKPTEYWYPKMGKC